MTKTPDHGRTLLLASMSLPSARELSALAQTKGWHVHALDQSNNPTCFGPRTFYGGSDRALEYAARFDLCLIEPPLDLLARMPPDLLSRRVRFGSLTDLAQLAGPIFVKPADPVMRCFDAGVYRSVGDVKDRRPIDGSTPILVSEPVEWTSEFRLFILNGRIIAWSPYLSFGRPVWKPGCAAAVPSSLTAFCKRMVDRIQGDLPPAFGVDVGVLEDR